MTAPHRRHRPAADHETGRIARGHLHQPGLARYLRTTPSGLLRIDTKAVKAETNLDSKYLLRTSGPSLSAADIALGYKQLLEVERGWRDMKQIAWQRRALSEGCHPPERPR